MSICLYKKGDKHIVDGVKCEIVVIESVSEMESLLDDGHVHDVKDLNENPVRAAAREAGIEGWETATIAALKKALKAAQDENAQG